jgi:hypothetical protein
MLSEAQEENCYCDRGCMSQSNREQGADDRRAAFFLQAKSHGKQPAHGWIQTVVGTEKRQRNPGPVVIHG